MATELVIAPTAYPVDTAEIKRALCIPGSDDDAFIDGLVGAAVEFIESATKRKLMPQTWTLYLDCFPLWEIQLPFAPARQVNAIRYYDADDTLQTLSTSLYQADTKSLVGRVVPVSGESWPDTYDRLNAVEIEAVYGHASAAAVPHRAKQAIRALVAHWYENREATIAGTIIAPIPFGLTMLIRNLWTGKL